MAAAVGPSAGVGLRKEETKKATMMSRELKVDGMKPRV